MPPKKRRQGNNKENIPNIKLDSISIETIIEKNIEEFEKHFQTEYHQYENNIQEKLNRIRKEFDQYMQTHQSQNQLARLIEQQITRIHQQQIITSTTCQSQELLDKTTDLMNVSTSDSSRIKTYLIGELQMLPFDNGKK